MEKLSKEFVAQICHMAIREWCMVHGDLTQVPWDEAPPWQRASTREGVQFRLENPRALLSAQHDSWMADRLAAGWTYGPEKDVANRTHPCLVPYHDLPEHQRQKDRLFVAVVEAFRPFMQPALAADDHTVAAAIAIGVAEQHGKVEGSESEIGTLQELLKRAVSYLKPVAALQFIDDVQYTRTKLELMSAGEEKSNDGA